MAHSTFLPGKVVEFGWLNKPVNIFNEKHNRHYQIYARDSRIYQSEYGLDKEKGKKFSGTPRNLPTWWAPASMATLQFVRRGDYLFEAPLSYYSATKAWGLSPNYDVREYGVQPSDYRGLHGLPHWQNSTGVGPGWAVQRSSGDGIVHRLRELSWTGRAARQ